MGSPTRILSIDGGGIRGIVSAMVLAELETRAGRPVAELFDLVAGTSTGAIIALALARPGSDGRPAWSAADLVRLYEREGASIFHAPLLHRLEALGSVLDEKYPADGLERALDRYLGETTLREALVDVLVPAYEIERRIPFFFKSWRAREDPQYDFPMRLVARATSAAPTYFPPARIPAAGIAGSYALVDGGVFANNPAMCAYAEARARGHDGDLVLLSLGTGELNRPILYDEAKDWGLLEWARPLLHVIFDGASATTDYELHALLGHERYARLQTTLEQGSDDLDDVTEPNLRALKHQAEKLIADHDDALDAWARRLTAPG